MLYVIMVVRILGIGSSILSFQEGCEHLYWLSDPCAD